MQIPRSSITSGHIHKLWIYPDIAIGQITILVNIGIRYLNGTRGIKNLLWASCSAVAPENTINDFYVSRTDCDTASTFFTEISIYGGIYNFGIITTGHSSIFSCIADYNAIDNARGCIAAVNSSMTITTRVCGYFTIVNIGCPSQTSACDSSAINTCTIRYNCRIPDDCGAILDEYTTAFPPTACPRVPSGYYYSIYRSIRCYV